MAELDRQVLFQNEAFAIGVLQVVSGAAAAGALSQFTGLADLVGPIPVLIFITFMVLVLVSAVLAAFFRHQYKMWDVKLKATKDIKKAEKRSSNAKRDLARMRKSMTIAVELLCLGFLGLVASLWWYLVVAEWVQSWSQKSP